MLIQVLVQVLIQLLYFFIGIIQLLKLLRFFLLHWKIVLSFLKKAFFQLLLYQNSLIQQQNQFGHYQHLLMINILHVYLLKKQ